jgi:PrtD family type I secretion system ABC transporter
MPQSKEPAADSQPKFYAVIRGTLFGLVLFSMVVNLLALTGPLFMLQVYDRVLTSASVPTLVGLVILMVMLYLFMGLLDLIRSRVISRVSKRLDYQLGSSTVLAMLAMPNNRSAGLGTQPMQDLDKVKQFLGGPGALALFDLPWIPAYLGIVYLFHPWPAYMVFAGILILFVQTLLNERLSSESVEKSAGLGQKRQRLLEDARRNAETVGALGMHQAILNQWQKLNEPFRQVAEKASDIGSAFSIFAKTFRMLMQSAMLGLGAYLVLQNELSPGMIIAVSVIGARALAPIEQSTAHWKTFIGARQAWRRLTEFHASHSVEHEISVSLPKPAKTLTVENAAITPPGGEQPLLSELNFTANAGDIIGVIGGSGAGKTTLARGITGVWPVTSGSIRFDGATLDQWPLERRGEVIGYLPQDIELFDGTLGGNISRFAENLPEDAILSAARRAGAHEVILALEEGYETQISDRGRRLSGGQRQLIALARALYGSPFVVVLDEPNSNLDNTGLKQLIAAIKSLTKTNAITFVMTHSPQMLGVMEKVLVLAEGRQAMFDKREKVLPRLSAGAAQHPNTSAGLGALDSNPTQGKPA